MLPDAAPGKGCAAGIGNIVISSGTGHTVKGHRLCNGIFGNVLFHVLSAHQLGNLGKATVAGMGQCAFYIQGAVGGLTGHSLGAVFVGPVTVESHALNSGYAFQRSRHGDDFINGPRHISRLQKAVQVNTLIFSGGIPLNIRYIIRVIGGRRDGT